MLQNDGGNVDNSQYKTYAQRVAFVGDNREKDYGVYSYHTEQSKAAWNQKYAQHFGSYDPLRQHGVSKDGNYDNPDPLDQPPVPAEVKVDASYAHKPVADDQFYNSPTDRALSYGMHQYDQQIAAQDAVHLADHMTAQKTAAMRAAASSQHFARPTAAPGIHANQQF